MFADKKVSFVDALTKARNEGKKVRPSRWRDDHEMRHYVIVWHNPPGTKGCWVMQSTEDPDAQHMALMPSLEDVAGTWDYTA